jgi:hypothetical protein
VTPNAFFVELRKLLIIYLFSVLWFYVYDFGYVSIIIVGLFVKIIYDLLMLYFYIKIQKIARWLEVKYSGNCGKREIKLFLKEKL